MTRFLRDVPSQSFTPMAIALAFLLPYTVDGILGLNMGMPLLFGTVMKIFFGGYSSPMGLGISIFTYAALLSFLQIWRKGALGNLSPEETLPTAGRAFAISSGCALLIPNLFLPLVCFLLAVTGLAQIHEKSNGSLSGSLVTEVMLFVLWLSCIVFTTWATHWHTPKKS